MGNMIEIKGQQVSEDTIVEALRKHIGFEEKREFLPITVCHIRVSVTFCGNVQFDRVDVGSLEPICCQLPGEAKQTIAAIQSAIGYSEKKG